MRKPVIVIADLDDIYMAPLELKFVEELGDKADLQIITDNDYFAEYFSYPKNIDILLVSEDLYRSDLQKHTIKNIFVLTEQMEEVTTEVLEVTKILKYTSIKEIYNQVMASNLGMINNEIVHTRETEVVLVYSPLGGVGKTTLAMGISASLAQNYKKVLYINAEKINTFGYMLNNSTSIPNSSQSEFSDEKGDIFINIKHLIRNEKFDYLPPFGFALSSISLNGKIYENIIKSARRTKTYDVIVVDTDMVFDEDKVSLLTQADKVLMVINQSKRAVVAMNILLRNISCHDNQKYIYVCNDFDDSKENSIVSSEVKNYFTINEYVKHIDNNDVSIDDLAKNIDIQKVAFLVM